MMTAAALGANKDSVRGIALFEPENISSEQILSYEHGIGNNELGCHRPEVQQKAIIDILAISHEHCQGKSQP